MSQKITVTTKINAPVSQVWNLYNDPEHIVNWNNASDDWHTTKSVNDLRVGGTFMSRMEAKDGSEGFDFTGTYDVVENAKLIEYTLDDGRHVMIEFEEKGDETKVRVSFDPEDENPVEVQRAGWQAILGSFKGYLHSFKIDT